jgi:hypothetical protein
VSFVLIATFAAAPRLLTIDPDPIEQASLAAEDPHDAFSGRTTEPERRGAECGDAKSVR